MKIKQRVEMKQFSMPIEVGVIRKKKLETILDYIMQE